MSAAADTAPARQVDEHGYEPTFYHLKEGAQGPNLTIEDFSLWYGQSRALWNINLKAQKGMVTSLIGPSGCGKSTLLRSLNRMNDLVDGVKTTGQVALDGMPIFGPAVDVIALRKRMGMVFQKPNPFPMSIAENVTYPLKVDGMNDKTLLAEAVENGLKGAALWDEVKDRLKESALGLSGGQQQRLCIARAIAGNPEVLLMDEPCSALDPIATMKIEDLIDELKGTYTILIVTHNMQQAARCADQVAFFYLGELIEVAPAAEMFTAPKHKKTQEYITGRFG